MCCRAGPRSLHIGDVFMTAEVRRIVLRDDGPEIIAIIQGIAAATAEVVIQTARTRISRRVNNRSIWYVVVGKGRLVAKYEVLDGRARVSAARSGSCKIASQPV